MPTVLSKEHHLYRCTTLIYCYCHLPLCSPPPYVSDLFLITRFQSWALILLMRISTAIILLLLMFPPVLGSNVRCSFVIRMSLLWITTEKSPAPNLRCLVVFLLPSWHRRSFGQVDAGHFWGLRKCTCFDQNHKALFTDSHQTLGSPVLLFWL